MDLPSASSSWSVNTYDPDGHHQRRGTVRIQVEGDTVQIVNRRRTMVAAEIAVSGSERVGNRWTLTAEDGTYWTLASCNCGG